MTICDTESQRTIFNHGATTGMKATRWRWRDKERQDHLSPEVWLCEKDQTHPQSQKGPPHSQTLLSIKKWIALPDIIHSYIHSFVIPILRADEEGIAQMQKGCLPSFHLICIVTCWLVSWFASFSSEKPSAACCDVRGGSSLVPLHLWELM